QVGSRLVHGGVQFRGYRLTREPVAQLGAGRLETMRLQLEVHRIRKPRVRALSVHHQPALGSLAASRPAGANRQQEGQDDYYKKELIDPGFRLCKSKIQNPKSKIQNYAPSLSFHFR